METILPILLGIGLAVVMSIESSGRPRTRAWRALRNAPHGERLRRRRRRGWRQGRGVA